MASVYASPSIGRHGSMLMTQFVMSALKAVDVTNQDVLTVTMV